MNSPLLTTFSASARGPYENCSFVTGRFFRRRSVRRIFARFFFFFFPPAGSAKSATDVNKLNTCSRTELQLVVRRTTTRAFARTINLKIYRVTSRLDVRSNNNLFREAFCSFICLLWEQTKEDGGTREWS